MAGGQPYPPSPRVRVQVGSALTLKVGQEDQAIATRGNTFSLAREMFVGIDIGPTFQRALWQANIITHPAQREASSLRDSHEIPGPWHRVIEGMHARNGAGAINPGRIGMSEHNTAGANGDKRKT